MPLPILDSKPVEIASDSLDPPSTVHSTLGHEFTLHESHALTPRTDVACTHLTCTQKILLKNVVGQDPRPPFPGASKIARMALVENPVGRGRFTTPFTWATLTNFSKFFF